MQRCWLLGPKRIGPNLLLSASAGDRSLFDSGDKNVVHLNKKKGTCRPSVLFGSQVQRQNELEGGSTNGEDADHNSRNATADEVHTLLYNAFLYRRCLEQVQTREIAIKFTSAEAAVQLGFLNAAESVQEDIPSLKKLKGEIESGLVAGFQLATSAGPLCDEPMWGVAFEIDVRLRLPIDSDGEVRDPKLAEDVYGPFHGQVMTVTKSCCRQALMEAGPRLVEALYLCEVSTSSEFLSGVYSVISRRRGRIIREEMREGSDMFTVHGYLPLEASFGLADELRSKSSGAASCSLVLSHWERLDIDPFFVPKTEEEREEFGNEASEDTSNLAKRLIYAIRKRKGLVVQEKVVESATKQRTLAKKV